MHVIRCDESEIELLSELHHLPRAQRLLGKTVVVNFQKKSLPPEDINEVPDTLAGVSEIVVLDELVNLAIDAAAQADEAFRVFGERLLIDPRLVIHSLEMSD